MKYEYNNVFICRRCVAVEVNTNLNGKRGHFHFKYADG